MLLGGTYIGRICLASRRDKFARREELLPEASPTSAFNDVGAAIGALAPGDTLYIMGELTNDSYDDTYSFTSVDDAHLWHKENTIKINNLHGSSGSPITITSYADDPAILKGDGANILRITSSSHLVIENLEIYGEVERIPLSTAKAVQFTYRLEDGGDILYRVDPSLNDAQIGQLELPIIGSVIRTSYTDTRGLYMSNNCHHVIIRNNHIHHVPGNGLRVANSEHVAVVGNKVHDTSRKSYSGTHGLVVTHTLDNLAADPDYFSSMVDIDEDYRAVVIGNEVYQNYNEIYSWVGTKTFITTRIDEGKGVSLQRNNDFKKSTSRVLVANNVAYWNGYSGIHSNDGDNIDFFGNTAYMNSYTNTVTYANGEQRGKNIGISMSGGTGCRIANNIAVIDTSWDAFPVSITTDMSDIMISNNVVYGTGTPPLTRDADETQVSTSMISADPLFADVSTCDYRPTATSPKVCNFTVRTTSPAINQGNHLYSLSYDFELNARSLLTPTIGAIEFASSFSSTTSTTITTTTITATTGCGDNTCGAGEDCNNCAEDCNSKTSKGNSNTFFCCVGDSQGNDIDGVVSLYCDSSDQDLDRCRENGKTCPGGDGAGQPATTTAAPPVNCDPCSEVAESKVCKNECSSTCQWQKGKDSGCVDKP